MKKLLAFLTAAICLFSFAACGKSNGAGKTVATVVKEETLVVITVEEVDGEPTLLAVMEKLQADGQLTFTADGTGMVTSIEGKENPADWSACWMLYTTDSEMADASFAIEWQGKSCGSSVVGANALTVLAGESYIWSYQTF